MCMWRDFESLQYRFCGSMHSCKGSVASHIQPLCSCRDCWQMGRNTERVMWIAPRHFSEHSRAHHTCSTDLNLHIWKVKAGAAAGRRNGPAPKVFPWRIYHVTWGSCVCQSSLQFFSYHWFFVLPRRWLFASSRQWLGVLTTLVVASRTFERWVANAVFMHSARFQELREKSWVQGCATKIHSPRCLNKATFQQNPRTGFVVLRLWIGTQGSTWTSFFTFPSLLWQIPSIVNLGPYYTYTEGRHNFSEYSVLYRWDEFSPLCCIRSAYQISGTPNKLSEDSFSK